MRSRTVALSSMITLPFGVAALGRAADTHRRLLTKCTKDLTNQWS